MNRRWTIVATLVVLGALVVLVAESHNDPHALRRPHLPPTQ